jgi:hypothetical protein
MSVYLAAAIDLVEHGMNPFEIMAEKLKPWTCFNPLSAYRNGNNGVHEDDEYIASANLAALKAAKVMVAWVSPKQFSLGLSLEVIWANLHRIPVIFVMSTPKLGVYARLLIDDVITPDQLSTKVIDACIKRYHSRYNMINGRKTNTILRAFTLWRNE